MIGYRFLPPAEEEMVEASNRYEAESQGLGREFLEDVQRIVIRHLYRDRCKREDLG